MALRTLGPKTFAADTFSSQTLNGSDESVSSGIASAEAFGVSSVTSIVATVGLESTQVGISDINVGVDVLGLSGAEIFGSSSLTQTLLIEQTTGVASGEEHGQSTASITTATQGLNDSERVGLSDAEMTLNTVGLPSEDAFGVNEVTSFVVVEQTTAIVSGEAFGEQSAHVTARQDTALEDEEFGASVAAVVLGSTGFSSTQQTGVSTAGIVVNSLPLGSDEAFGTQDTSLLVNAIGLGSDESFGSSFASYDQVLNQVSGVESGEAFGSSSIPTGNAVDDYSNDAPDVITKRRPLRFWPQRRGGGSGVVTTASPVTVVAEMLTPALDENASRTRGADTVMVGAPGQITVQARLLETLTFEGDKKTVTVRASLLAANPIVNETPRIAVRVQRLVKVA